MGNKNRRNLASKVRISPKVHTYNNTTTNTHTTTKQTSSDPPKSPWEPLPPYISPAPFYRGEDLIIGYGKSLIAPEPDLELEPVLEPELEPEPEPEPEPRDLRASRRYWTTRKIYTWTRQVAQATLAEGVLEDQLL